LRDIAAGFSDLHKGKFENVDHDLAVLQIQKIRNISAPKANENSKTAPKLLKIALSDDAGNEAWDKGKNTFSSCSDGVQ